MANYKVVFRSDNQSAAGAPGWEPGCPLLINAMQVSRNTDSGQCYLQLKLSNISGEVGNSYELKAAVTYADGTTETVELRPLDADIAPGKNYRPDPVALTGSEVANVTARIGATSQAGGCWQSAEAPGAIPAGEPVALEGSAAIEPSRTFADLGKSPERYQRRLVEGDTWWVCPCGMPNVGRATCCACGIPHDTLRQLEDETALNAKAEGREVAEKIRKRKKRNATIITTIVSILVIAVAAVAINAFVVQPEQERRAVPASAAAVINGETITEQEVIEYIAQFREGAALTSDSSWAGFMKENGYTTESIRKEVLDYLIDQQLLKQAIHEQGVIVTQEEIDAELAEVKRSFDSEDAYRDALSESNLTEASYLEQVVEPQLLRAKLADAVLGDLDPDDKDERLSAWLADYRSTSDITINSAPAQLPYSVDNQ